MRLGLSWGQNNLEVEVADGNFVPLLRAPPAPSLDDPAAAVTHALEHPLDFPALRLALTPDDQVAIAVDETLPNVATLLVPILDHVSQARIAPQAITLVCLPPSTGQPWIEELPDAYQDVRVEMHDPHERKKLAYLASTRRGRRIYLNRTAVDADQLIVLSGRGFDPLLGIGGGEGVIFPGLGDEAIRTELAGQLSLTPPTEQPWPLRAEAAEVAWLLGAPFLVQAIAGAGDGVSHVLAGPVESSGAGQSLTFARWRVETERYADIAVGTIGGSRNRVTFLDLARAFQCLSRIVTPGGRMALLTDAAPELGPSVDVLRGHDDPARALKSLMKEKPSDLEAGFLWASAAEQGRLYLLSGLSEETVEDMFAVPLGNAGQLQRMLGANATCAYVPDAHRTLALVRGG